jgi:hypothetical protein
MTSGKKVIKGKVLFSNFNNITDITDDIDKQTDYGNLIIALKRNKWHTLFLSIISFVYYFVLNLSNICFELKSKLNIFRYS